jgi:hypothetical protein
MEIPVAKKFAKPPENTQVTIVDDDPIMAPVVVKAKVGRPTKYDPSWMLEEVIEIGRRGGTHTQMAVAIGVTRETFYNWLEQNNEFFDAVKIADAASQTWWEERGQKGAMGLIPNWNPTTYIFNMKNRFRDSYSDKPQIGQPDENGQVQVMSVTIDSRLLDADQRETLRQTLLAAKAAKDGSVIEGEYEEDE